MSEKKSGCLVRLVKGAVYTGVALGAAYFGADYYFDKQFGRSTEEKQEARQGIENLVQGREQAGENFAPAYVDFLTKNGYWEKMKDVELLSQQLLQIKKGKRADHQTALYRVKYHNKSTGETETNICTLDMILKDGKWTIQGE